MKLKALPNSIIVVIDGHEYADVIIGEEENTLDPLAVSNPIDSDLLSVSKPSTELIGIVEAVGIWTGDCEFINVGDKVLCCSTG